MRAVGKTVVVVMITVDIPLVDGSSSSSSSKEGIMITREAPQETMEVLKDRE